MLEVIVYTIISVFIVSVVSLAGIFTLSLKKELLDKSLLFLVSLSVGSLFGDAFIHLIPSILEKNDFTLSVSLSILLGIFIFFVLEELLHWRSCQMPHDDHDDEHEHHHHNLAIMNLAGDGIHNFIDGLVIAASYFISIPVGIATTIAVIAHEVPQEISDYGILLYSGLSKYKALFYNFLSALMSVVGAIIGLMIGTGSEKFIALMLPLAAGGFIYIAGADLIPELHKQCSLRETFYHIFAFLLGVGIMVGLLFLE